MWEEGSRAVLSSPKLFRALVSTMDRLPDFTTFPFTHAGRERTVYRKGEGPAVLIMHEVPGISAEVVRFAPASSMQASPCLCLGCSVP